MAGFTDLLGSLLQNGMAGQASERIGSVLRSGGGGSSLNDIIGGLGKMIGGADAGASASSGGGPMGGVLGNVLGNLAGNKAALGGLGALAGALLGGGGGATRGAVGGGALAMLASLAMSALKNAGETSAQTPTALVGAETPQQQAALEADATILIKAMINAAKADGKIDDQEIEKIVGKLSEDGLHEEGKQFFMAESAKPMDTPALVAAAQGRPELAAQIYAASLLAITVDTPEETAYLRDLADRLGLSPQVTGHIEQTLGVQGM